MTGSPSRTTGSTASTEVAQACQRALAYADLFDYPLTDVEVHRYLPGLRASLDEVRAALGGTGLFTLPGREHLIETRRRREQVAARLWPEAVRYGRVIARLPLVQMVAVTGALAVDNVEGGDDIDYLIVAEPDRVWSCRALVIGVVRWAARRGVELCPNYVVSAAALTLDERSLFAAHELAQMVPLSGFDMYGRFRAENAWAAEFLPNASGPPHRSTSGSAGQSWPARTVARLCRTRLGQPFERWERNRKVAELAARAGSGSETAFSADRCKGHFEGHGRRTLEAYERRLAALGAT